MACTTACSPATPQVLHPGDVAGGERGGRFETLLGSCVAVVITDPRRTFGAMCHIVHAADAPATKPEDTSYADAALARLFAMLRARGLNPALCEAWIFGGGNMFPTVYPCRDIGACNVAQVRGRLHAAGVRVLHEDVGGVAYRRLRWTVGPVAPELLAFEL